jgi:hypothetical protein
MRRERDRTLDFWKRLAALESGANLSPIPRIQAALPRVGEPLRSAWLSLIEHRRAAPELPLDDAATDRKKHFVRGLDDEQLVERIRAEGRDALAWLREHARREQRCPMCARAYAHQALGTAPTGYPGTAVR